MYKWTKKPGSFRIIMGTTVVCTLLFFAFFGERISIYPVEYMDPDCIMEPPSIGFFRSWLITEKGLRNLKRTSKAKAPNQKETQNFLKYLDENLLDSMLADDTVTNSGASSPLSKSRPIDIPNNEPDLDEANLDFLSTDSESLNSNNIAPYEEENNDFGYLATKTQTELPSAKTQKHRHYFGTDKDGRDMLSLLIAGAKTSLLPGLIACLVALGLGIPLGLLGGFYGGWWADAIRFFNSVILSFPRFVLILVVICALEPNVYYTMVVLGLTIVPRVSELFQARVRILSNTGFVLAAKESGLSDFKIMVRHLFWFQNRTLFFIQASLIMSESILVETTLSYLQFGAKPPAVSWGNVIEGSRLAFFSEYYWITFFPAIAIVVAILGFFYLGDGLNVNLEHRERK